MNHCLLKPFLLLPLLLTSCGSLPKKNIKHTQIAAREPVRGFTRTGPRHQRADFLTLTELKSLAMQPKPGGALEDKLRRFFSRPIISNEAWYRGKRPARAENESLGEFIRVATWNIEKSLRAREAAQALRSATDYEKLLGPDIIGKKREELLRERERLASSDVILLQEMDLGVTRSGYRDAAREIAQALGMNYAYAPQQLEIDPVMLGLEPSSSQGSTAKPDPARYKGVFGLAVLSRYPIKNATCFQLQTQPYDWFEGEKEETALMEDTRRFATEIVFENKAVREMKIGGRIFFRVDLEVPGIPDNTLTVIHNHLEIKARPQDRDAQMAEILDYIKDMPHTVVMAGDHNTSKVDLSPTSTTRVLARTTMDSQNWFGVGMNVLMTVPVVVNSGRILLNNFKNLHSPMAPHIPMILPNRSRSLFNRVRDFRFADGGRFDFRGDRDRSINRSTATLANSNEKAIKGHTPSFRVTRPIGPFGLGRLDWIFVKAPPSAQPNQDSYRLAPHFGETLSGFLDDVGHRLSDHAPCVLDIPLQEPKGL